MSKYFKEEIENNLVSKNWSTLNIIRCSQSSQTVISLLIYCISLIKCHVKQNKACFCVRLLFKISHSIIQIVITHSVMLQMRRNISFSWAFSCAFDQREEASFVLWSWEDSPEISAVCERERWILAWCFSVVALSADRVNKQNSFDIYCNFGRKDYWDSLKSENRFTWHAGGTPPGTVSTFN